MVFQLLSRAPLISWSVSDLAKKKNDKQAKVLSTKAKEH
jgi:hypothetical protein